MRFALLLCQGLLICLMSWQAADLHAAEQPAYTITIIPVMPPAETKRRWQPVLDYLTRDTGLHFRFRFHDSQESFEKELGKKDTDFAVMSPVNAWQLREHYRPLLRSSQALTGIVVVPRESHLQSLPDLQGQRLALQEGDNLSANRLIGKTLKEQKITTDFLFSSSESNAIRSMMLGKADAALVNSYLLTVLPREIASKIRIIHRSAELPALPLANGRNVPAADLQKLKDAMLRLRKSQPALLESILMPDITEALAEDYSGIGKLLSLETGNGP